MVASRPTVCIAGVTTIEFRVADVTFNVAEPLTEPEVAVMVTFDEAALAVTRPVPLTGAEPGTEDVHWAAEVMSSELPSL